MKKITQNLLIIALMTISVFNSYADDFYVSVNGDDSDGTTLATAFNTLGQAYNAARNTTGSDKIIIDGTINLQGVVLVLNDASGTITFESADDGYGGTQAVLTNSDSTTLMIATNVNSSFSNTVFTGIEFLNVSNTLARGGVININNQVVSISFDKCLFKNNSTSNATGIGNGVIYIDSSNVSFTDCVFDSNSSTNGHGGVMRIFTSANVNINRCLFYNNSARRIENIANAGAILIEGSATITNSTFYKNSATNNGGAIYIPPTSTGNVTMTNVSAFDNSVENVQTNGSKGGFVRVEGSNTYTFNNMFLANNKAYVLDEVTGDVIQTRITDIGMFNSSALTLNNSLVTRAYGNTDGITATSSHIAVTGTGLDVTDSNIVFDDSEGLVKFNTVPNTSFSPIDLGDASFLSEFVDQNGNSRPDSGPVDAGAWESGLMLTLSTSTFDSSDDILGFYSTSNGTKIVVKSSAKAELYNFLGAKIDAFSVNKEYEILDSNYSSGAYILKVEIDGRAYAKKFIVK